MTLTIHTDGAARGNPGPAGIGAVIQYGADQERYYNYLGKTTNNRAEYEALLFALIKAQKLIQQKGLEVSEVVCYSDSELLVKQLNREYKVKEEELAKLFVQVWNKAQELPKVAFVHVRREKNKEADKLANIAIDEAK